jgi:hypothetical protein
VLTGIIWLRIITSGVVSASIKIGEFLDKKKDYSLLNNSSP